MLPSVVPRLATDSAVRVFPGVWKLLSFLRLPSQDRPPSLPLCLSFYLLYFFLPPFKDNGLLFWVPDVLWWHSEVVLWNLLSVQIFFWWICGGKSGLPVLFLCHLRTTPTFLFSIFPFFFSPYSLVLFSLLYSPVGTLLYFYFPVCALVSFVLNWWISFLVSFVHQVNLLCFIFVGLFWFWLWLYMYIFHYFNYYLPDFVTAICLGFIFHFSFLSICFNLF